MAMIDEVRSTVLGIINKNNYGYLSPQDYNLYATQAQLDLYEDYFYQYNQWINKENKRQSGTGYADIVKGLVEVIDSFSQEVFLTQTNANIFSLPTDYYLINKLYYYPELLLSGTFSASAANVMDALSPATPFIIPGGFNVPQFPSTDSLIVNTSTLKQTFVTGVPTTSQISVAEDLFTVAGNYSIYSNTNITEVERVSQNKIFYLTSSTMSAPTNQFPAYVLNGNNVSIYPTSIRAAGQVKAQYVRYPKTPQWTYSVLNNGTPLYDPTVAGYQDFELPLSDMPGLIAKICQYIGIEIRESEVYNFGTQEIVQDNQIQV
jgi:hypothetical protein|tara:strand:- start:208 stop:1164 length:957 start_codon:yes stop_codon:yes gene_type:complete